MMDQDDWDELTAAEDAAGHAVAEIVMQHRTSGILTWALLHQIEEEVVAKLKARGKHSGMMLNMIRAAPMFGYPKDDRPVSFANSSVIPVIFGQIEDAWKVVH